jgi:single-strand DNA-binding protein
MSVNKVILVGRLGHDPETRFTSGGQSVCNFTVATDEVFRDRAGERQKRTEWHRIVMWGKLAEIGQQYLKRGTMVYLEGRLRTRQWDDRSGNKRTSTEIIANVMKMLSPRGEAAAPAGEAGAVSGAEPEAPSAEPEEAGHAPEISDEDIPF